MKGNERMNDNLLHSRKNIIRGGIIAALLFTLCTITSFTASADNQSLQSTQSHTIISRANILSSGGGGPSGTADLQWNPQTQALTATVHLNGLQPRSSYANHIHAGDCSAEGKMLYPFNNVITDTAENGTATT